jgi:hypothetical protein
MQQEHKEKEEFYQTNKEKLMNENSDFTEVENDIAACDQLKAEIKATITNLDAETKKGLQAKLKSAGLPVQYQKLADTETLAKILSIVAQ